MARCNLALDIPATPRTVDDELEYHLCKFGVVLYTNFLTLISLFGVGLFTSKVPEADELAALVDFRITQARFGTVSLKKRINKSIVYHGLLLFTTQQ